MFMPMFIPTTRIVNKTIVYSDTVLPLKDMGNNLKVTVIDDVQEHSLNKCLKTIFESNPNVIFNTIQYSKNKNKVYFYTDKIISIKEYEESRFIKHNPITSKSTILEETKKVLVNEKNQDEDCISLYNVSELLKELKKTYNKTIESYKNDLSSTIEERFDAYITSINFNYQNNELNITFKRSYGFSSNIYISKQNNDLYISKLTYPLDEKIFMAISSLLSNLYDKFISFADYKNSSNAKYNIKAVNSIFNINISHYGTGISIKDFNLSSPSDRDEYSLKCNSSIINEFLKGKEAEIFKRIFVRINDCPIWAQSALYEIRHNQLVEEQKKQKRLELKRKVFPFLKNKGLTI